MTGFKAKVNRRLLAKANKLCMGTVEGRVIEILQNARRAGATRVSIRNEDGYVTVRDNSDGIEDFTRLLDLGGSGWGETHYPGECPAGAGLVCLAGRELTVRSGDKSVTIDRDDWQGKEVAVTTRLCRVDGVLLRFNDEPWTVAVVEPNAVFCGMDVTVDGETCEKQILVSEAAREHPELGCRIEVRKLGEMGKWHDALRTRHGLGNTLVNYHGRIVSFGYRPVDDDSLGFLVELTGELADTQLMLSANTQLVADEALARLKAAIELDAFRYVQECGKHRLPYRDFLRAKALGVELPEAEPTYRIGLLEGNTPKPVAVTMPASFPLAKCYRLSPSLSETGFDPATNAHLLAALGKLDWPFVPVRISACYDGYSWSGLPTIEKVNVTIGEHASEMFPRGGWLVCVESIVIEAHTSDGEVWGSPVCMAKREFEPGSQSAYRWAHVYVTRDAETRLKPTDILFHLGGLTWDEDPYDRQEEDFEETLEEFWLRRDGPEEVFRRDLIDRAHILECGWRSLHATPDGVVKVECWNGVEKVIRPPADKVA